MNNEELEVAADIAKEIIRKEPDTTTKFIYAVLALIVIVLPIAAYSMEDLRSDFVYALFVYIFVLVIGFFIIAWRKPELINPQLIRLNALYPSSHSNFYKKEYVTSERIQNLESKLEPNLTETFELAELYRLQSQYTKAVDKYNDVLKKFPDHVPSNSLLGGCLLQLERTSEAVPFLEKALQLDPYLTRAKNNLAFAYGSLNKNLDEAYSLAYEAFEDSPWVPHVLDTLGYILILKKEFHEAHKYLMKAKTIINLLELPENSYLDEHLKTVEIELGLID